MNPLHLEGLPSFAAQLAAHHAPPTPREPQRQAKTPAKGSLRDELVSLLIDHPRGLTLEQIATTVGRSADSVGGCLRDLKHAGAVASYGGGRKAHVYLAICFDKEATE